MDHRSLIGPACIRNCTIFRLILTMLNFLLQGLNYGPFPHHSWSHESLPAAWSRLSCKSGRWIDPARTVQPMLGLMMQNKAAEYWSLRVFAINRLWHFSKFMLNPLVVLLDFFIQESKDITFPISKCAIRPFEFVYKIIQSGLTRIRRPHGPESLEAPDSVVHLNDLGMPNSVNYSLAHRRF